MERNLSLCRPRPKGYAQSLGHPKTESGPRKRKKYSPGLGLRPEPGFLLSFLGVPPIGPDHSNVLAARRYAQTARTLLWDLKVQDRSHSMNFVNCGTGSWT